MTPSGALTDVEIDAIAGRYAGRDRPLMVGVGGMYGILRSLFGPEALSVMFYDDPQLVHDVAAWRSDYVKRYALPLLRRLKPEIVQMGEDLCYNNGMLLSPAHFHEFCGPHYRMVCDAAREHGADLVAVDTDGNYMEFADVAVPYGVNGIFPSEVKAGNDLFELRARHPRLVLFGWLEKEVVNEGNEHLIEPEIASKVPALLGQRGYFPNGDHGIQPLVTFPGMCRFMTLLHEVCGNPEGEFPRT
jgi:uroporphyrinogen decarboxylase